MTCSLAVMPGSQFFFFFFRLTQRAERKKKVETAVLTQVMSVQQSPLLSYCVLTEGQPPHQNTVISTFSHWLQALIGCWFSSMPVQ